jgi:predicted DNA-binding helix-hairpin-helix protein
MSTNNNNSGVSLQIPLWNEVPRVPSKLTAVKFGTHRNKLQEMTAESITLLPINGGKDKATGLLRDSLKVRNPNMTAEQLVELHKSQGTEMKGYLGTAAMALVANEHVIGLGIRYGRKGRVNIAFQREVPQVEFLTDEECAKAMGQSLEWVRANRREQGEPIELEQTPESSAPAPAKKPATKPKAGKVVAPAVSTPAA